IFVPLKPQQDWPELVANEGLLARWWPRRPRTKDELVYQMNAELDRNLPGVDWDFSQYIRDNVMEALSGVKAENSLKIIGPDLEELEKVAEAVKKTLSEVRGIENTGVFHIKGQSNLEMRVDPEKCSRWGGNVADVTGVIESAVRGKAFAQMTEGEKTFDMTLRWPERLRASEADILQIPVDGPHNAEKTAPGAGPAAPPAGTPRSGARSPVPAEGRSMPRPALTGAAGNATGNNLTATPHRRLGDLVTPVAPDGSPDPTGQYIRPGASTIYREQGK